MSLPALRQPKFVNAPQDIAKTSNFSNMQMQYVIVTLRDKKKLVLSSDAYDGIIMAGEIYKCVFCDIQMELDPVCKDKHKNSASHRKTMHDYPHIEEFGENLIRKLRDGRFYCTICNVVLAWYIPRHITSDVHCEEFEKAATKVAAYKPFG